MLAGHPPSQCTAIIGTSFLGISGFLNTVRNVSLFVSPARQISHTAQTVYALTRRAARQARQNDSEEKSFHEGQVFDWSDPSMMTEAPRSPNIPETFVDFGAVQRESSQKTATIA